MIDVPALRLILRNHLLLLDGTDPSPLPAPRAWENREFTPPNPPSLWIRETLMLADETLPANNTLEAIGYVQYDVFGVKGRGTEDAEGVAKTIKAQFPPATGLANSNAQVSITKSRVLPGREDAELWWSIPVQIFFRAYALNIY